MKFANEVRAGNIIKVGRDLWLVVKADYYRAARKEATVQMKLKNIDTGNTTDTVYKLDDKLDEVRLDKKPIQFLYKVNDKFSFMDQETFEQFDMHKDDLGNSVFFIKEDDMLDMMFYEGRPLNVELPNSIDLTITYTENGVRGDTSGKVMKPATLETGLEVSVPMFCGIDDIIRVDTATLEYKERVKGK